VNSAFVANAVNHIRPKAKSKGAHKSKENKENESRTGEVSLSVYSVSSGLLPSVGLTCSCVLKVDLGVGIIGY